MSVGLQKTRLSCVRGQFRRSGDWLRVRLVHGQQTSHHRHCPATSVETNAVGNWVVSWVMSRDELGISCDEDHASQGNNVNRRETMGKVGETGTGEDANRDKPG